jgi:AcrR family transcriptional regulator
MQSANDLRSGLPAVDARAVVSGWDIRRRRITANLERVALGLFAERGYESVTVAEIATAAGSSPRTVARYFPFKEDFVLALPRRACKEALQRLREVAVTADPVAAVWDTWLELARLHSNELDEMLLWHRAMKTAPELRSRAMSEVSLQLNAVLTELCGRALNCDPKKDVRASALASMLAAANDAVVAFWLRSNGSEDPSELLQRARGVLPNVGQVC